MNKNKILLGCIALLSCNSVFADDGKYDLSIYGNATTTFWQHKYYQVDLNDNGSLTDVTHTGNDYNISIPNSAHEPIYSYGFGKVISINSGYGAPTVQHLLENGQYVYVNLLHLQQGSLRVAPQDYLVRKQFIGKEGNTTPTTTDPHANTHLHLEVAGQVSLAWIESAQACPGAGCERNEMSTNYDIGDLQAYYKRNSATDKTTPFRDRVWYDPEQFGEKRELLPYFSASSSTPSASNFDVYSTRSQTLSGFLNVNGQFQHSSIIVRKTADRSLIDDAVSDGLSSTQKFLGGRHENQNVAGISGQSSYGTGDYIAAAYVKQDEEQRFGFPVKFSVVRDVDVIVDNDQLSAAKSSYFCSGNCDVNKVPGYYLTASVFESGDSSFARWQPKHRGNFSIDVHVPEAGDYSEIMYYICERGQGPAQCDKHTISSPVAGWGNVIKDANGDKALFSFNQSGYVLVRANDQNGNAKDIPADAIKFSAYSATWFTIRRELKVGFNDAQTIYRHFMVQASGNVQLGNNSSVTYQSYSHNGVTYSRYSNAVGSVYIDRETGNVLTEVQCDDGSFAWDSPYKAFLNQANISGCNES